MAASPTSVDPLGPIAYITNVLMTLLIALVVLLGASAVTGSGSLFGFGHDEEVCVSTSPGSVLPYGGQDGPGAQRVFGVHPGIESYPSEVTVCDSEAGFGLRLVASVPEFVGFAFLLAFLVLVRRLVSHARRHGLFTAAVARRVTLLGAYVLVGTLLAAFLSAIADGVVLHHAQRGEPWEWGLANLSLSVPTLIAGFGILSFGRVLHIAVRMQHEIDATI